MFLTFGRGISHLTILDWRRKGHDGDEEPRSAGLEGFECGKRDDKWPLVDMQPYGKWETCCASWGGGGVDGEYFG